MFKKPYTVPGVLLATLLFTSHIAWASDPGIYIGGGVGAYTLDVDNTNFDDDATVARVFAGLQFTENLAIEGEYQKLFESEDDLFGAQAELEADPSRTA